MHLSLALIFIVLATAANGLLAGASLDQSIKQLPTRHRIGILAYSSYSLNADLGPGIIWYASLGEGSAVLTLIAAIISIIEGVAPAYAIPVSIAGVLAILHSLVTLQTVPLRRRQKRLQQDTDALDRLFTLFTRWQTLRVSIQVLNFCALLWAVTAMALS